MKNFYFFQVNYSYGKSAHLPYTAALLSCYAFADKNIAENYELKEIFFLRDTPDVFIEKIDNPALVAFSSYIWNFEFNKTLARMIKEKYPGCVIVFGGHHIAPGGELLETERYMDFLIHGEGEEAFRRIMLLTLGLDKACDISGISYREGECVITNPSVICHDEMIDMPSPYLEGYFDKILEDYPDTEFMALIETTRGCPNSCSYCDWSNMKSRIRKFPMQRVLAEIKWISEHHIFGLGSADSNFGIFERDEEIAAYVVERFLTNGYPGRFQTSYAKKTNDRIFRIGLEFEKYNLNRGITLSFQSMSDDVLANIGRKNIPVSHYRELMDMYNAADIPTYTELILGLPGETYESFASGIDILLNLGQHNSIYIHNCEELPCAVLSNPGYVEKFGIQSARILLNQPHIEPDGKDEIKEYSNLVVQTNSMSRNDWIKMNFFSFVVQAFHHMGILQLFALYLHSEKGVTYRDFYEGLCDSLSSCDCLKSDLDAVRTKLRDVSFGCENASFVIQDDRFGAVHWPFEEFLFLAVVYKLDEFFEEIRPFLKKFDYDNNLFDELVSFQKKMIKRPFFRGAELSFGFNFCEYFRNLLANRQAELLEGKYKVSISAREYISWDFFAKDVAWFGRKDRKNIYINDSTEEKTE